MPVPRLKRYEGPALLSYGFRPFFLFGSIFAAVAMLLWLAMLTRGMAVPTAFSPRDWHVHEMLYGFLPAIVCGFLFTAIPNWTGRMPLQGLPLLGLVLLWIAGRIAIAGSALVGWPVAAAVDLAFLAFVIAAAAREIIVGQNWRNLRVLAPVAVLFLGNALFHGEAARSGMAEVGTRLGVAAMLVLVMLIGGRIIPSFTRNWLARRGPGRLPAPFSRFDAVSLAAGGLALAVWTAQPDGSVVAVLLFAAGLLQAVRLARWAGDRTGADPLVLILHLAFAFVPAGFLLTGLAALGWIGPSAGIHAWTVGAFGGMTLAVMSRASLGHTGRALVASTALQVVFAAVLLAAVVRIGAGLLPEPPLLTLAAVAWSAAFGLFAASYGRILTRPSSTGG